MIEYLYVELLSDATFAGGAVAGDVDIDVAQDELGLPLVPGTALKRLLAGAWRAMAPRFGADLRQAAVNVFGVGGELDRTGMFDCGDAGVPPDVAEWIAAAHHNGTVDRFQTLDLLTTVRAQTAVDPATGAPAAGTLRQRRAVVAGLELVSESEWLRDPAPADRRVLALAALAARHGGLARNRGAGHLRVTLGGDLARTRRLAGVAP